jgi:hypothetical protein
MKITGRTRALTTPSSNAARIRAVLLETLMPLTSLEASHSPRAAKIARTMNLASMTSPCCLQPGH